MSDSSPQSADFRAFRPFHAGLRRAQAPELQRAERRLSRGRCASLAPQRL